MKKMKQFFKVVCILMVLVIGMSNVSPVYAEGMSARTILKLERWGTSDSGRIKVQAMISVQDSYDQIVGYSIIQVVYGSSITDVVVMNSGITTNNTQVYVYVKYEYRGVTQYETVYLDMYD